MLTQTCDIPDFGGTGATHRLVYYQWGNQEAARTVVCVHGLTRNGRDFDPLARRLADDGFRVICPDMPGRGQSQFLTETKGYIYPAYVADMLFLLHTLNITKTDWIGTSMGGIIGMMVANTVPGLLRSLVLNDIGCVVSAVGLKRIAQYAGGKTRYATLVEAQAALRERCAPFGIREEAHWQQLFAHSFMTNPDGTFSFACDPAIATNLPPADKIADVDLWALWEALKAVPTLLIRGAQSDILTQDTAVQMQASHPDMLLREIEGCGHAPALMDDAQISLIEDWLRKK